MADAGPGNLFQRHDLLKIDPRAWREGLAARPELQNLPHLSDWARQGWPVIVRRYLPADCRDLVPIAIPLPPGAQKLRIALALPKESVIAPLPPVSLREAQKTAPSIWQDTIEAILAIADQHQVNVSIFGSLLWQALTGLDYLRVSSDLDLLWHLQGASFSWSLIDAIAWLDRKSPVRIDGEIRLSCGGLNWREIASGQSEILVKTLMGIETHTLKSLLENLECSA